MNVTPTVQKLILTLLILLLIGYVGYSTLFGKSEVVLGDDGVPLVTEVVGRDILILADRLDSININKNVFSSPLFTELVDISSPLLPEDQGRPNPFVKIGSDSSVTSTVSRP
jgi:hypothetical protein